MGLKALGVHDILCNNATFDQNSLFTVPIGLGQELVLLPPSHHGFVEFSLFLLTLTMKMEVACFSKMLTTQLTSTWCGYSRAGSTSSMNHEA